MPLTFAHPAAILPFSRKNRYVHFSAMVFGSMSPDFEYFFRGQPMGEIGHTLIGFVLLNLPLVALFYYIYHFYIHHALLNHSPVFLQDTYTNKVNSNCSHPFKALVFCYSALFGMFTHVAWDSFTHINGYMVQTFPAIFMNTFTISGFDIPLFKFLQHGSTALGILLIIAYLYFRALSQRHTLAHVPIKQKLLYWSSLFLLTIIGVLLWNLIDHVPLSNYGIIVVRIIDSALISLLLISLIMKRR